jgi:hypothetical protein
MSSRFRLSNAVVAATLCWVALGAVAQVVVRVAPPPPMSTVVIGVAPGPRYVWIPGYQSWNGSRYVWVAGRWVIPPRVGVVWVPAHWIPRSGGYVFVSGHWR